VAIQELPDLNNPPPSHVKDKAYWQEQWDEAHWMPGLCGPGTELVVGCLMHQSIAEAERGADVDWHLQRDKAASPRAPSPAIPPPQSSRASPSGPEKAGR
jgi:hypothetical protein